jgi:prepilin-type N-terminal cleavage/methylation domain-containing protein
MYGSRPGKHSRPPSQGFTFIEVAMAIMIFGLLIVAITQTMRTGLKAWNTGHGLSELLQSVRITQDIILNDLNHIIFLTESDYNRTFRDQTQMIANMVQSVNMEDGNLNYRPNRRREDRRKQSRDRGRQDRELDKLMELENVSLEDIATPINLTFQGSGSSGRDELKFTRRQQVKRVSDINGWGLRRIKYHVDDGILYRSEEDAFGYSPGSSSRTGMVNTPELLDIMYSFVDDDDRNNRHLGDLDISREEINFKPVRISSKEPMCRNVELFDIAYGYFQNDNWVEVQDWNSGQLKYRSPPIDEDEYFSEDGMRKEIIPELGRGVVEALAIQQGRLRPRIPDDMPGYLAIQLGLRMKKGKGKIHSFTIYHMMPQGQESDLWTDLDEEGRDYRSDRRRERKERRDLRDRNRNSRFRKPGRRR